MNIIVPFIFIQSPLPPATATNIFPQLFGPTYFHVTCTVSNTGTGDVIYLTVSPGSRVERLRLGGMPRSLTAGGLNLPTAAVRLLEFDLERDNTEIEAYRLRCFNATTGIITIDNCLAEAVSP